jgi:capsid protein
VGVVRAWDGLVVGVEGGGFFDQVRYSVLRYELAHEWQPRTHTERMFVEQLARAFTAHLYWLKLAVEQPVCEDAGCNQKIDRARRMSEVTYREVARVRGVLRELRP